MAIDSPISAGKSLLAGCVLLISACSYQPAQHFVDSSERQQHNPANMIRISAVGDIMLGGTSQPVLQDLGYDYPFEQVKHLFTDSDIVIGNLEGPLTNRDTPFSDKEYLFKTPPELVAPALKKAGFTIMNLANNHIMDFGTGGMTDTLHALHQVGIETVGVGDNLQQARHGTVVTVKNMKIGFLSYSLTFPKKFWASDSRAGTAFGHEHQIRADVRQMKKYVDILVVSYHVGRKPWNCVTTSRFWRMRLSMKAPPWYWDTTPMCYRPWSNTAMGPFYIAWAISLSAHTARRQRPAWWQPPYLTGTGFRGWNWYRSTCLM